MKRAKRNCNCRGICSKILSDINNGRRKSSDNVFSHCLRCFPARDKRNHLSFKYIHTRARARWWNVRKCAARSSLHARTEFIVPCSIALNRPWEIAIRASVRGVRLSFQRIIPIEIYSYPIKFLIGCDFLLSSKSRETSIIVVSPRHTLRNFHPSLETSVRWISRKRWFTSNRAAALRYFSCGAVTC